MTLKRELNNGMGPTALRYIRLLILRHLSGLYSDQAPRSSIHSVCFSPNSDYLATGGGDGQIRVSYRFPTTLSRPVMIWLLTFVTATAFVTTDIHLRIKTRFGISRTSGSTHPLKATRAGYTRLITQRMVDSSSPVPEIARHVSGILTPTATGFLRLKRQRVGTLHC